MDLTTRCPQCKTTFPASLEQLQLRKGYIRCVQCAHIFDGYEAVVASDGVSDGQGDPIYTPHQAMASAAPPEDAVPYIPRRQGVSDQSSSDEPTFTPAVVRGRRKFTISDPQDASVSVAGPSWHVSGDTADRAFAGTRTPPEHTITATPAGIDGSDHPRIDPDHVQLESDERGNAPHYIEMWREPSDDAPAKWWQSLVSAVWLMLIVAGVLIFAAQLVYVFRAQIAETMPALRPTLERMCTALDCRVAYARQIDMVVITQSSLQQDSSAGDAEGSDTVVLQLTLRNVYESPQEWPTLVLDLKDFSGALIARKHLPKDTYLPAAMTDNPFPASSEHLVVLPLMVPGLKVNGYQLTAFFP